MRLAIISDIHGNISALNAVLDDIHRRGVEDIVNLGDVLSGPMDARATAEHLMPLNIPTVCGNHDRQLIDRPKAQMGLWEKFVIDDLSEDHLAWVATFPAKITRDDLLFCHATPNSDAEHWLDFSGRGQRFVARDLPGVVEKLGDTSAAVVCCGHTHTPRLVRVPNGQMIVNPGAVGLPAYFDTRSSPPVIQQTGAPDARYAILEKIGGVWRGDLIAVPYHNAEMVRLAREKAEESWGQALETGWIT